MEYKIDVLSFDDITNKFSSVIGVSQVKQDIKAVKTIIEEELKKNNIGKKK